MKALLQRSWVVGCLIVAIGMPAQAAKIAEEPVSFSTHDGLTLEGLITYPSDASGPFPGMLLIAGGGLQDADVTIDQPAFGITDGTQKHFRALSRYFSRQGWAVLRYNKRGASFDHLADRPELLSASSLDDLVADARTALRELLRHPKVAAKPLVLYAHSEGTLVATRLASELEQLDLLVLAGAVAGTYPELLEYQLVERNLDFFRFAVDADRDGALTAEELAALDDDNGTGSIFVHNCAEFLFDLQSSARDAIPNRALNPETDVDSDGRIDIGRELEPRLRSALRRLLAQGRAGMLGEYFHSMLAATPNRDLMPQVAARVLFVHGELDVQTPLDEPLILMSRLEAAKRSDYDALFFPGVGHTLSPPNDIYLGDGRLSTFDNLTLNAPMPQIRQRVLERIEAILQAQ